jgi:hypothetical protein
MTLREAGLLEGGTLEVQGVLRGGGGDGGSTGAESRSSYLEMYAPKKLEKVGRRLHIVWPSMRCLKLPGLPSVIQLKSMCGGTQPFYRQTALSNWSQSAGCDCLCEMNPQ